MRKNFSDLAGTLQAEGMLDADPVRAGHIALMITVGYLHVKLFFCSGAEHALDTK